MDFVGIQMPNLHASSAEHPPHFFQEEILKDQRPIGILQNIVAIHDADQ